MLLKISNIKNFGIFRNFEWDKTVINKENKPLEFRKLNLIYARNYSGKTTLSRLIQCIEFKQNNPYYDNSSDYELYFGKNSKYHPANVHSCPYNARVYNKDFIESNLRWGEDSKGNIKAFSVMGKENIEIANIIDKLKPYMEDNNLNPKTFSYHITKAKDALLEAEKNERIEKNKLKDECSKHARKLKENRGTYGVKAMYERNDLEDDLKQIKSHFYVPLPNEIIQRLELQIQDIEKSSINNLKLNIQDIDTTFQIFTSIIKEKVTPSQVIQELDISHELSNWAFNGIKLHKAHELNNCSFCGNEISRPLAKVIIAS